MMIRWAALAVGILAFCGPAALAAPQSRAAAKSASRPQIKPVVPLDELEGREWRLTRFDRNELAPQDAAITLKFEADRMSGNAGCNRYVSRITAGNHPGPIEIDRTASTRKACPGSIMETQSRYLSALGSVERYSLDGDQLVLTYRGSKGFRLLMFDAAGAPAKEKK